jgi:ABC-type nitrate/sulfonate/bicarbonate transport system substrate-binding protein
MVSTGIFVAPAVADTTLTVGKAAPTSDNLIVVDVGNDLGFFKKRGLDLKILNFRGTAPLVQAMTAGSLDIALADGTMMAFIVKGAPMMAVCHAPNLLTAQVAAERVVFERLSAHQQIAIIRCVGRRKGNGSKRS